MNKIIYNDGLTITVTDGENKKTVTSDFYTNYVNTQNRLTESNAWKTTGDGAKFRGDAFDNMQNSNKQIKAYLTDISFTNQENVIAYSIVVDDVSAIMKKDITLEKDSEMHVIHSNNNFYNNVCFNEDQSKIACCCQNNLYNSHLAVLDLNNNDLTTYTAGDSWDGNSFFFNDNEILFSTKGVARDGDGNFVKYSNSSIEKINLYSYEITEVASHSNYNYEKPTTDSDNNLYYIKKPYGKESKSVGRFLIDILLIPFKIIMAIYYFLETFTMIFTGKTFTEKSSNPTKTKNKKPQEILIEGNLVNIDKEYKNNVKHKEDFAGLVPRSWELIKVSENQETVIAKSVIDYAISKSGEIVYTNGKHVILINTDGTKKKIASTSLCTKVNII